MLRAPPASSAVFSGLLGSTREEHCCGWCLVFLPEILMCWVWSPGWQAWEAVELQKVGSLGKLRLCLQRGQCFSGNADQFSEHNYEGRSLVSSSSPPRLSLVLCFGLWSLPPAWPLPWYNAAERTLSWPEVQVPYSGNAQSVHQLNLFFHNVTSFNFFHYSNEDGISQQWDIEGGLTYSCWHGFFYRKLDRDLYQIWELVQAEERLENLSVVSKLGWEIRMWSRDWN